MARPRIYLAGPEVFLPDAAAAGVAKRELCASAGFEGIFPLDQALDLVGLTPVEQARVIYRADCEMMRSCAAAIANLTPFRGVSMDSGTAFEVGFMRALGRPILGYTNVADDYANRATAFRARGIPHRDSDRHDVQIEDFGLSENLMIEIAIAECGGGVVRNAVAAGREMIDLAGFRQCLAQLQKMAVATSS